MVETAKIIWADGPIGSPKEPDKSLIRAWGTWLENLTNSLGLAVTAAYIRGTKAQLDAVTGAVVGAVGIVVADDTVSLRGVYVKASSSWVKKFDLPTDAAAAAAALAVSARDIAINARIAAEAARDIAAGYASDAVNQGNVPIYSSVAGMPGLTIPAGISSVRVNGFSAAGDAGGGMYIRSTAQPTGEFAGLAFRSADRFLPDGSTSSANGGWWEWKEKFDASQICQRLAARIARGDRTIIAAYGDSTTDGNSTTGWTANPKDGSNVALGSTDHNLDAPNAWPARLGWTLGAYYAGEDLKIMNCGYGGRKMNDGWAVNNFQVAVVQNSITFAGRVPDVVIIGFGLNDITDSTTDAFWLSKHISETRKICRLAMSYGIVPILQTCDPMSRSDPTGYDSFKSVQMVDAAKAAVAKELGVALIDTGAELKGWLNRNKDLHNYSETQTDALHGGDVWSAFKGSAVARYFMRDFVTRSGAIGPQRISASDSAMQTALGQGAIFPIKQSADGACYSTPGGSGSVAPGGIAADLWIWNEDPDCELIYRGVGNENVSGANLSAYSRPAHDILDLPNMYRKGNRIPTGIGFSNGGHSRRCDVPYRVGKLAYGMNRVRYTTGDNPYYFFGHYELISTPEWGEQKRGYNAASLPAEIQVNALKGCGRFTMEVQKGAAQGVTTQFIPQAPDFSNVIGLMNGDSARLYLRAVIPEQTGVILGWTKSYVAPSGDRDDLSFFMLYRSGANSLALYLGTRQSGAVTFTQIATGTFAQTPEADGAISLLIVLGYGSNTQTIRIYDGWDFPGTTIISLDVAAGGSAAPMGFVMGGLFANPSAGSGFLNPKIHDYFGKQFMTFKGVQEPSLVAPA